MTQIRPQIPQKLHPLYRTDTNIIFPTYEHFPTRTTIPPHSWPRTFSPQPIHPREQPGTKYPLSRGKKHCQRNPGHWFWNRFP